ncbi:hypothetical protein GCM10010503_40150 [Streptomyces lucensis JCM 4490]|uniref:Secreted protein n=1 Tax=Streptomyces lucensis JCM 4490 TaxID=1306176 RepID=A0A918J9A3_9ACTN|nr:hypothetical protein GCM10010503_40150 [Streptomyces lucensis JCM 4490]
MASRIARTIAVAAAGAGLALSLAGSAQANDGGGSYSARLADGCGSTSGTYHWYDSVVYNGKPSFRTNWDFDLWDLCSTNGYAVSLYRKYSKWNGSAWVNDGSYHKMAASGSETKVADVRIFLCEVGRPSTCVGIS